VAAINAREALRTTRRLLRRASVGSDVKNLTRVGCKSFFGSFAALMVAIAWTCAPAIGQTAFQYVNAWTGDGRPLPDTMGQATDFRTCNEVKNRNLDLAPSFGFTVDREAGTFTDPKSGITIKQSCITNPALLTTPVHPFGGAAPKIAAVPCPTKGVGADVWFIFGQSIAGNYSEGRYTAGPNAYAYAGDGLCYPLGDPVIGGEGEDAGPWTRLADLMMNQIGLDGSRINRIVVIERAIAGSSITDWIPGGTYNGYLVAQIKDATANGLTPTRFIFSQGEANTGGDMTTKQWANYFNVILTSLRSTGAAAPVYVSQETICNLRTSDNPSPGEVVARTPDYYVTLELGRIAIRAGQTAVVNGTSVRAGPNLDQISAQMRADGCHMGYAGLVTEASLWMNALTAH
jgi:Carbohydrate esterase, sialic acid-specific acetylesterase